MAKRKKKIAISHPAPGDEQQNAAARDGSAQADNSAQSHSAGPGETLAQVEAAPRPARRVVGLPSCIAGMLLCLVLGIYLGTLLPGLMSGKGAPAPKPAASAPVPPPVGESMDPQLARAIADLEKRAAANPDSAPDWINLGNVYFDAHKPEQAIKAYERALTLAPDNADVLTDLGIMYRETGDFERAVASFRKAIAIEPGHQNAMFNEGVVLAHDLGKKSEAAAAWQRLLDINPGAESPAGAPLKDMIRELQ